MKHVDILAVTLLLAGIALFAHMRNAFVFQFESPAAIRVNRRPVQPLVRLPRLPQLPRVSLRLD